MKLENLARATDLAEMRKACVGRITSLSTELNRLKTTACWSIVDKSQIGSNGERETKYEMQPHAIKLTLGSHDSGVSGYSLLYIFDKKLVIEMFEKQIAILEKRIEDIDKELESL